MRLNISRTRADASPSVRVPVGRVPGTFGGFPVSTVMRRACASIFSRRGEGGQFREGAGHQSPGKVDAPFHFTKAARQYPEHASATSFLITSEDWTQLRSANSCERGDRPHAADQPHHAHRLTFTQASRGEAK